MELQRVIAIGFFDGVHRGHGALLARARQVADRLGLPAAAVKIRRVLPEQMPCRESRQANRGTAGNRSW